jgi:hypothetical protein
MYDVRRETWAGKSFLGLELRSGPALLSAILDYDNNLPCRSLSFKKKIKKNTYFSFRLRKASA